MSLTYKIEKNQKIVAKFIPCHLPQAKKSYNLRPAHQTVLDIKELASKADVYKIDVSPNIIEQGLTAGMELMYYLVAEGYRIKTPVFNLSIKLRGEYDGIEDALAEGIYPRASLKVNSQLRKYLKERVKVEFDGVTEGKSFIVNAFDEASGLSNQVITRGDVITIKGSGLKIDCVPENELQAGVFFKPPTGVPIKASRVVVNEHKTLKVLVPAELIEGTAYQIAVETWSSPKGHAAICKNPRDIRSSFSLVAA
jgi:hypothetical protein